MINILIIGAFGFDTMDTGGQPVKTRELYHALCRYYKIDKISTIETMGWRSHFFSFIISLIISIRKNDVIIMLPAHNGFKIISRILTTFKKPNTKLFYCVIGGWLASELKTLPSLIPVLSTFSGIWVETNSLRIDLINLGLNNVFCIPNFKSLKTLTPDELVYGNSKPLKVCTFSRVMREKGIEDAIKVISKINQNFDETIYTLDIYGQVDKEYFEDFEIIQESFPDYINYKGVVPPSESVDILKGYFALLFPTHFYTEGIPGTIIDAYAAGVPVITSLWLNYTDVFIEGITGRGYKFGVVSEFEKILYEIQLDPEKFSSMKLSCLEQAKKYHPDSVISTIARFIESE